MSCMDTLKAFMMKGLVDLLFFMAVSYKLGEEKPG